MMLPLLLPTRVCSLLACVTIALTAPNHARADDVVDIANRRQLFVSPALIDRLDGTRLKLQAPRAANTILSIERPWEGNHNFGIGAYRHAGRHYLYYRSMPGENFGKFYAAVVMSDDGINWSRPNLGLVAVNGTTDNNVLAMEDDQGRLQPVTTGLGIWLDENPTAPDAERFKLAIYSTNGGPHVPGPKSGEGAVHTAEFWVSADGFRFRKKAVQPNLSSTLKNSFDGVSAYFWSEAEQQYVAYFRWYDKVRTIARTTSPDLVTWSKAVPMTYGDTPREHLYENMTSAYFRAPELYIALATRFMEGRKVLSDEQFKQLKLSDHYKGNPKAFNGSPADGVFMTTRAGSTEYDRTFMESFVRPGIGPENWVGRGNYQIRGIFQTGPAEMSFYVMRHYQQPTWRLDRMTLRLDGFASVNAPYRGGSMVTKPFKFQGRQLTINYATSVAGEVRVEAQDAAGKPIPGFALADADPIAGDEISRVVTWGGKSDVTSITGQPIRLYFKMRDADLFAFRFE